MLIWVELAIAVSYNFENCSSGLLRAVSVKFGLLFCLFGTTLMLNYCVRSCSLQCATTDVFNVQARHLCEMVHALHSYYPKWSWASSVLLRPFASLPPLIRWLQRMSLLSRIRVEVSLSHIIFMAFWLCRRAYLQCHIRQQFWVPLLIYMFYSSKQISQFSQFNQDTVKLGFPWQRRSWRVVTRLLSFKTQRLKWRLNHSANTERYD
jgi:hypothetical protein